jgi:hypothetical protein
MMVLMRNLVHFTRLEVNLSIEVTVVTLTSYIVQLNYLKAPHHKTILLVSAGHGHLDLLIF